MYHQVILYGVNNAEFYMNSAAVQNLFLTWSKGERWYASMPGVDLWAVTHILVARPE